MEFTALHLEGRPELGETAPIKIGWKFLEPGLGTIGQRGFQKVILGPSWLKTSIWNAPGKFPPFEVVGVPFRPRKLGVKGSKFPFFQKQNFFKLSAVSIPGTFINLFFNSPFFGQISLPGSFFSNQNFWDQIVKGRPGFWNGPRFLWKEILNNQNFF